MGLRPRRGWDLLLFIVVVIATKGAILRFIVLARFNADSTSAERSAPTRNQVLVRHLIDSFALTVKEQTRCKVTYQSKLDKHLQCLMTGIQMGEVTMNDKDFINKTVVSMADGATVGKVKDLVFHGLEFTSLVVSGERGEGLLPFASIGKNGPDAITIESYTLVDWNAGRSLVPESRTAHDLKKLSVVDGQGNNLGHISDFTMNGKGHIQEFVTRTEGVFGIGSQESVVSQSRVRAIGPEMITVEPESK